MRICSECERPFYALGYCKKHYDRVKNHGTPDNRRGARPLKPPIQRILERTVIDPETGCWRGAGRVNPVTGYAGIRVGSKIDGTRKYVSVHRLVYEELVGPIDGELDHVYDAGCRYKDCHNPDHLEDVTRDENMQRRSAVGRY